MQISDAYQSALDYIFSYVDFSKTHSSNLAPENFNLSRMFDLLNRIGDPHKDYPSIHIAGTKGKGSTAALCASALTAARNKTGLYTSPHLQDFSERIQVDGKAIPQGALVRLLGELKQHIEAVPRISTFEIMTALAFRHFADQNVDVAVLEVGLGGRLDATNVVSPLVTVITSISLDHTPILGTTIAEIAGEKAGIIKPEVPVIVSPQEQEAIATIRQFAQKAHAPLIYVSEDVHYKYGSQSLANQEFFIETSPGEWDAFTIPLIGEHQVENAVTAWTALKAAKRAGLKLSADAIERGFNEVRWPGRFEVLRKSPYVILDSAHNADSARRLAETIDTYFPDQQVTLIFGTSGDKSTAAFLTIFLPITKKLITTQSIHPRAMPSDQLGKIAEKFGHQPVVSHSIEEALEMGHSDLIGEDILLITGSVFVVGGAREILKRVHNEL